MTKVLWETEKGLGATGSYLDLTTYDVTTPKLNSRPYQTLVIREVIRRLVHAGNTSGKNVAFIRDDNQILAKIFPEASVQQALASRVDEALEAMFELAHLGASANAQVMPVKGKAGSGWKITALGKSL